MPDEQWGNFGVRKFSQSFENIGCIFYSLLCVAVTIGGCPYGATQQLKVCVQAKSGVGGEQACVNLGVAGGSGDNFALIRVEVEANCGCGGAQMVKRFSDSMLLSCQAAVVKVRENQL